MTAVPAQPPAVPDELVKRALDVYNKYASVAAWHSDMAAALAAVADDLRAEGAAEVWSRYARQYEHAEKMPRWDEDKGVVANGWAAGRCGNCGEAQAEIAELRRTIRNLNPGAPCECPACYYGDEEPP